MASFVKLDLDQWEPPEASANPAKVANLPADPVDQRQRLAGLAGLAGLPDGVAVGIARLKVMRVPRLVSPDAWPIAVADASYLAESGWAAKALAMGPPWSVHDLFGTTVDRGGDPYEIGLAVWLQGRRLLALDEKCAVVPERGGWAYYHRREQVGAKLLWELDQ